MARSRGSARRRAPTRSCGADRPTARSRSHRNIRSRVFPAIGARHRLPASYGRAMRVITLLTCLLSIMIAGGAAQADRWDSKGWVKLGERTVNGRVDKDTITVGRDEGKYTKLTVVVEKSDIELLDFEVVFANGEKFNPG